MTANEIDTPDEWADVARHKYEHYRKLCDAYEAGGENTPTSIAIAHHERSVANLVPHLIGAIDRLLAEVADLRAITDKAIYYVNCDHEEANTGYPWDALVHAVRVHERGSGA